MNLRTVEVQLGDRSYVVTEAPRVRSAPWRKRLAADLKPLFDQLGLATDLVFNSPADLLRLWPVLETILVDGVDLLFELLLLYAPPLQEDRAYIEEHATDRQIMQAFGEVVRLADPFGLFSATVQQIGRKASMMSQS